MRPSTSYAGFSSATSRTPSRPDAAARLTTARTTLNSTPNPAGALTPGATAAGSTSRSMLRCSRSHAPSTPSNSAPAASAVQSSSVTNPTPRSAARSNSTLVFPARLMPATA